MELRRVTVTSANRADIVDTLKRRLPRGVRANRMIMTRR
jgi:hypothetical protein